MRHSRRSSAHTRRGTVAPLLVFSLTTLLACFAFAVNKSWLWTVREDVKLSADAAALAAAATLVDDDLIRNDVALLPALLQRAAETARNYGAINPVRSAPLLLLENPDNAVSGDVVFGVVSLPRAGDFTPVPALSTADPAHAQTNSVIITGRQVRSRANAPGMIFGVFAAQGAADVVVTSSATLDRGVRGFRPTLGPTPLAPVALLSGAAPQSFESQVENGAGLDMQRFDRDAGAFVSDPAGDGVREFPVAYPTDPAHLATASAAIVFVGTSDFDQLSQLLINGVTRDDLNDFGRQLVLPETGGRTMAGLDVGPPGDSPQIIALYQALEQLRQSAAVRIWPTYSTAAAGQVTVTGFVAARVVSVTPPAANQPLQFTVQPTVVSRHDAITDTDLRGTAATLNNNKYVLKVRRVD